MNKTTEFPLPDRRTESQHFRSLIDASIDGLLAFDRECRYTAWNAAMERITGLKREQVLGHVAFEVFPFLVETGEDRYFREALAGRSVVAEARPYTVPETGHRGFFDGYYSPLRDEGGEVIGGAAIIRDITASREAQDALRASEERYRAFIGNSSEGIWRFELEQPVSVAIAADEQIELYYAHGYLAECNDAMAHMYGYDRAEEITGARLGDLLIRDDPKNVEYLRAFIASGYRLTEAESVEVDREGGQRVFTNNLVGVLKDGFVLRAWGTQRDVTERKRMEEELRATEHRFFMFMENLPGLAWIKNMEGRYVYANEAAAQAFRVRREELTGKSDEEIFPAETAAQFRENDLLALRSETGVLTTVETLEQTDGLHHSIVSKFRIPGLDHAPIVGGIAIDITEQKRAEGEREQLLEREKALRARAEEASRLKDEFLATVSHELRTPLTAILGWATVLRSNRFDGEGLGHALETIERNAKNQKQIIEDLLDVSRIITGKLSLVIRPVELASLLEAAVESLRPAAEAKKLRLQKVLDTGLNHIAGDPARLQQIVWNLLSNAIKFTPKGGRIQIRLERINSHVEITVSDTGQGISAEFLPFVFDRFRQADSTTTRKHGGLGLGLSIVRHLVELHGGTVKAESAGEGQGSSFTVILPLMPVYQRAATEESKPRAAGNSPLVFDCYDRLDGLKILAVDDEADTCDLLKVALTECGAEVTTARSAQEAMQQLERLLPDVLISDIGMPDEDGYEFIRRVRRLPAESGGAVPAVALTAYARAEDRLRVLREGYQMHVPKPVELAELIAVIASLVQRPRPA